MIKMNLMPDASEIVHYNNPDVPVYIQNDNLSNYPSKKALCHWHKDIELVYITEGEMNYHINGTTILLRKQDCVVINSHQLHYGYEHLHHNCQFICIRFHPNILSSNQAIYQKYVLPFIENRGIDFLYYDKNSPNYHDIKKTVNHMLFLSTKKEAAYELEIISTLHLLWRTLFCQCRHTLYQQIPQDNHDLALQKTMVSYIYEHYQENLTLTEIASSANISRSKCCDIFRRHLQQSPIHFLNRYRLEISRRLLLHSHSNITQIALSCGFNHLSYYSKIFFKEYGCTPTAYRKNNKRI